jgi:hypothetical protein
MEDCYVTTRSTLDERVPHLLECPKVDLGAECNQEFHNVESYGFLTRFVDGVQVESESRVFN